MNFRRIAFILPFRLLFLQLIELFLTESRQYFSAGLLVVVYSSTTIGFACAVAGGLGGQPAQAVVAGQEGGPSAGSTLMVLNARGGICTGIVLSPRAILTAAAKAEEASSLLLKLGGRELVDAIDDASAAAMAA